MITIDGAEGEGGGQVVRDACALALVTREAFRIDNVRGGRERPGLMRQHVSAIEAACAIGGATCEGAHVGSTALTFRPGSVRAGEYRFAVGTAGSTGLVLQMVLLPLLLADGPSRLVLDGGTHNVFAPPFEFIARSFLPVVNRMGPRVDARLVRHGFYPSGGGRIEVDIAPAPLAPIECVARGSLITVEARAVPAEQLAKRAAGRMRGYLDSTAFAGPYLADQLLLPFALAGGGAFTTVKPSGHALTAAAVIERFTGRRCRFEQRAGGEHLMTVA